MRDGMASYTDEQRAEALDLYQQLGPSEAARRAGVPKGTISSWVRRAGLKTSVPENLRAATEVGRLTLEQRRQKLASNLLGDIERLRGQLFEPAESIHWDKDGGFHRARISEPTFSDKKALATSLAILVDKVLLLTGQATSRTETVTVDAIEAEIAELRREMDEADI